METNNELRRWAFNHVRIHHRHDPQPVPIQVLLIEASSIVDYVIGPVSVQKPDYQNYQNIQSQQAQSTNYQNYLNGDRL